MQDGSFVPAVAGLSIRNSLYTRERPFHPARLASLLMPAAGEEAGGKDAAESGSKLEKLGLVRSKGVFWLATRSDTMGEWQQAGTSEGPTASPLPASRPVRWCSRGLARGGTIAIA